MNLLKISLTNRCNLECDYCPIKEWRNNPDFPNTLTNDKLTAFMEAKINPQEWHIELTGGEPALYPKLNELLLWLNIHGYKGLVKTNGMLPIPKTDNFKRIAAFHCLENPPKCLDKMLIIENQKDLKASEDKKKVCKESGIDFDIIDFADGLIFGWFRHTYKKMLFITPDGKLRPCEADREHNDTIPEAWVEPKDLSSKLCSACKAVCDFELFMR